MLCLHLGCNMAPVVPIHEDDGVTVDPNPMRLTFMVVGFVVVFVLASMADGKGKSGAASASLPLA